MDAVVEQGTGYPLREGAAYLKAFGRNTPTASPRAPGNFRTSFRARIAAVRDRLPAARRHAARLVPCRRASLTQVMQPAFHRMPPRRARRMLAADRLPPACGGCLRHQVSHAMTRTLIAFSSVDGQTRKISLRLKEFFERDGQQVVLVEIGQTTALDGAAFDRVIIGASVRYGKYRPNVYAFIEENRAVIEAAENGFFSVNLVARKPGRATPDSNPYIKGLLQKSGWTPKHIGVFAGMLDYPSYGFLDRQVIRLIMWLTSGPTDPTVREEFTDWRAVEAFAAQFARERSTAAA
jgi:menaquinone-dependent protoporphyrinogen oxidase